MMTKAYLALGAAVVAFAAATPAVAEKHYTNQMKCQNWRHGQCTKWKRMTRAEVRRQAYRVGYNFGPSYAYTDYGTLPQPLVRRYSLHDNFRYVNRDGYVYVVNPNTYRVVRVVSWP